MTFQDDVTFSARLCSTVITHPQEKFRLEQAEMAVTGFIRGTENLHENIRTAWFL